MNITENKKLLVIGSARHGKDCTAEFIQKYTGYNFKSSSIAAAEIFIYDALKDKYNYTNFKQCFEDRMSHRQEWYELICDFNKEDKSKLAKAIMKNNDIYVGMRDHREIKKCIEDGVFDMIIGIFNPSLPLEDKSSFNIDIFELSDYVIVNNGTLEQLEEKVKNFCKILK